MAEIFIRCPSMGCKHVLTVAAECRGLLVTCPHCKQMIRIPQARAAAGAAGAGVAAGTSPMAGAGAGRSPRGRGKDD